MINSSLTLVILLIGQSKRRRATFSSPTLHYGENNTWECKNPKFQKVHLPCYKVMQDNAKGTVLVEDDEIIPKRTFCLDTGGPSEKSEDVKGIPARYFDKYKLVISIRLK